LPFGDVLTSLDTAVELKVFNFVFLFDEGKEGSLSLFASLCLILDEPTDFSLIDFFSQLRDYATLDILLKFEIIQQAFLFVHSSVLSEFPVLLSDLGQQFADCLFRIITIELFKEFIAF
jgi:hypothetical protein